MSEIRHLKCNKKVTIFIRTFKFFLFPSFLGKMTPKKGLLSSSSQDPLPYCNLLLKNLIHFYFYWCCTFAIPLICFSHIFRVPKYSPPPIWIGCFVVPHCVAVAAAENVVPRFSKFLSSKCMYLFYPFKNLQVFFVLSK